MRSATLFALALLGLAGASGCKKHWEDDKLRIARESSTGDQLRIDGYYVSGSTILSVYVFYENGVLQVGDSFNADDLAANEAEMQSDEWPLREVVSPHSHGREQSQVTPSS